MEQSVYEEPVKILSYDVNLLNETIDIEDISYEIIVTGYNENDNI
jgi:hypothetical protein